MWKERVESNFLSSRNTLINWREGPQDGWVWSTCFVRRGEGAGLVQPGEEMALGALTAGWQGWQGGCRGDGVSGAW